jgi:hypothetical protein
VNEKREMIDRRLCGQTNSHLFFKVAEEEDIFGFYYWNRAQSTGALR